MNAREKPRAAVTLSPWPTMSPERIGIIGSTHGVKASTSPPTKKMPRTAHRLPVRSTESIESCSDTNAAPPPLLDDAPFAGAPAALAAAPPDAAVPEEAAPEAAPPPPGSLTFSVFVMGG